MKKYIIHYTKASGLLAISPTEAYCYVFKDGFIHFYESEDCYHRLEAFKSINQANVALIEKQRDYQG